MFVPSLELLCYIVLDRLLAYYYCELIASDFLLGENCQHVGNTNWELYVMCVLKNKW